MAARLYLVCGLPGAGKTTRCLSIAERVSSVYLCADEWVLRLGVSLVDFEFRVKLQDCLLSHAGDLLRAGVSVIVEFGSWHRGEREAIRQVATRQGATTELHFLNAPLDELVRRVRARGGRDAEALACDVLVGSSHRFEPPTAEEISAFDRYVGPGEAWEPA